MWDRIIVFHLATQCVFNSPLKKIILLLQLGLQALVVFVMCPVILVDPCQIAAGLPFGFSPSLGLIFLSVCPFCHEFLSDNRLGNIPPAAKEIKQSTKIKICFNNYFHKRWFIRMYNTNARLMIAISGFSSTQKKLCFSLFLKRVDTLELYLGFLKCVKTVQQKLTCQIQL